MLDKKQRNKSVRREEKRERERRKGEGKVQEVRENDSV